MFSAWAAAVLVSAVPPAPTFEQDVQPIFRARCWSCHGDDRFKGDLDLRQMARILRGGDSGPAIVPGKPDESPLLKRVATGEMPPGKDKLSKAEQETLRRWIDAGAPAAESAVAEGRPSLWSLQPLRRPSAPKPGGIATANPIDAFIVERLQQRGLSPSPQADRVTLIRRLAFDLTGLPPTPEEIHSFVADQTADADKRLVDRLLASPRFGERWARHWLDIVRFAESDGFETNQPRPNAWHYRDYVIRAFNENKRYDRFVLEQLAGDVLGADAATGFLVAGAYDQVKSPDVALTRQQRADELHDMVATVGSTFLGLTVGCARCHHHKFDPISHNDYHAIKAMFAGVHHGDRPVETPDDGRRRQERVARLRSKLEELDRAADYAEPLAQPHGPADRRAPVNARRNIERFPPVLAKRVRFTIEATNNLEPCIDELEVFTAGNEPRNVALARSGTKTTASGSFFGADIHKLEHINDGRYGNSRSWISNEVGRGWVQIEFTEPATIDRIVWARDREGKFKDRLATRYRIEVAVTPGEWIAVASSDDRRSFTSAKRPDSDDAHRNHLERQLREAERVPSIYAGRFATPEKTVRLHRGDPMQEREPVAPGGLSAVTPPLLLPGDSGDRDRRMALARWIVDPANPLTARVMVNRLWQYHFGRGLVDTPGDFGGHGAKPTHPELLDWLAAELLASGWDLKHIHRLIVTSAAFRQSSRMRDREFAADAENRLLWRYSPRRLEAETIRDSVLAVSDSLDLAMGGPGFDLFEPNTNYVKVYTPKQSFGPAEWRRMIYQNRPRMQPDDTFGAFDCPDAGQIAPRRTVSNTPLQALNLLNSPFMLQQCDRFAERLRKSAGAEPREQIRLGFRLAFGREPSTAELAAAARLVREHDLPAFCRAILNSNEFLFVN